MGLYSPVTASANLVLSIVRWMVVATQGLFMNKKTTVRGFLNNEPEEEPKEKLFDMLDTWLADWMLSNPAATNLMWAKDVINTPEIALKYSMETGQIADFEYVHNALVKAEYIFEAGGWLVR